MSLKGRAKRPNKHKVRTPEEIAASNAKKGNRTGFKNKKMVSDEDRLTIGVLYEKGVTSKELADKFGISTVALYNILNESEVKKARMAYKQASIDRLWIAFDRNGAKIDKIIDNYLDEATLENRIKRTDLPGLFKVFNSVISNKIKLKELSLKEHEIELKQKLIDANPEPDVGMIQDLLMVLNNNNTLKRIKYNGEEDKENVLDENDVDEDIKNNSKVLKRREKVNNTFNKHFGGKK